MKSERKRRRRAENIGRRAEMVAQLYLRLKGFRCLEQRARTPAGELDLVVMRGRLLVFVEVKFRQQFDAGLWAITAASEQRLVRAANYWLARHPTLVPHTVRFDLLLLRPWRLPRHMKNLLADRGFSA